MENILLVDGYNIIGAWHELRQLRDQDFEQARTRLVEMMAEYKASTGWRIIVVFDAHMSAGIEQLYMQNGVEIIYTRKNETADERIEKLSADLKGRRIQIHVATSDMTEQNVIFGQGALRKSARELELEMRDIEKKISNEVKSIVENKPSSRIQLSADVMSQFEKWRRGIK